MKHRLWPRLLPMLLLTVIMLTAGAVTAWAAEDPITVFFVDSVTDCEPEEPTILWSVEGEENQAEMVSTSIEKIYRAVIPAESETIQFVRSSYSSEEIQGPFYDREAWEAVDADWTNNTYSMQSYGGDLPTETSAVTIDIIGGGSVYADPPDPDQYAWVTLTIEPEENCKLTSLVVDGQDVTDFVDSWGTNIFTYDFMVPDYPVTVTAVFREVADQTVRVIWEDGDNRDGLRPEDVTAVLTKGDPSYNPEAEFVTDAVLNEDNGWMYVVEDLPLYDEDDYLIEYVWSIETPEGYEPPDTEGPNEENGFVTTFTFTHEPATFTSVRVEWMDEENRDGKRPDCVDIYLISPDAGMINVYLDESDSWWTDIQPDVTLYRYSFGQDALYEASIGGENEDYEVAGCEPDGDTLVVFLSHMPETVELTVRVEWNGGNENQRPDVLTAFLTIGETDTRLTDIWLEGANDWSGAAADLYRYENGEAIPYVWHLEGVPEGYACETIVDGDNTVFILTARREIIAENGVRVGEAETHTVEWKVTVINPEWEYNPNVVLWTEFDGGAQPFMKLSDDGITVNVFDDSGNNPFDPQLINWDQVETLGELGWFLVVDRIPGAWYRYELSFTTEIDDEAVPPDYPRAWMRYRLENSDIEAEAYYALKEMYPVTIIPSDHGTVEANLTEAAEGEPVVLTVTPDTGYVLDTLTVMQGDTEVEVIGGDYFLMPAGEVTVSASFRDPTKPSFQSKSLVLSGQIGVNFFMELPEGPDYSDSCMEFTVSGRGGTTTWDDFDPDDRDETTGRYYGFTCYVSSIQMADTITATFCYGDGETVETTFSVKRYIQYFDEHPDAFDETTLDLIKALADYGHYAQIFLSDENDWNIGEDYADMDLCYTDEFSPEDIGAAVGSYAPEKDIGNSGVTEVSFRLDLESATAVDVFLTVAEGTELDATALFNNKQYEAVRQSDGRYLIRVDGISAHMLGDIFTITGTADGAFTVTLSALSYVRAVLQNSGVFSDDAVNAMAALYRYYEAVMAYRAAN